MAESNSPSPDLFFQTVGAYQRSAALKSAIELDVFTAIADGAANAAEIGVRCNASERGTRMLCDYLTVIGHLTKSAETYHLTQDSAVFLNRHSFAYLGGTLGFLLSPGIVRNFDHLTDTVRRGTVSHDANTVADDHPVWVEFAHAMAPMMVPAAQTIASVIALPAERPVKVLDIAAGHGTFGITCAQRHPQATIVPVDWPAVLEVAKENAAKAGVLDRYSPLPGDAFRVDFGHAFDAALVTNFLHHFDVVVCTTFLRKVAAALNPGGRVAILEFVPNEDRVSPPMAASFVINMLAGTPKGDAYTLSELTHMLVAAGFGDVETHPLPTPETVIVATKTT